MAFTILAEDAFTTKTYTVDIQRAPSTDAALRALSLLDRSGTTLELTPPFDPGTFQYTAEAGQHDVVLTAQCYRLASIAVNGSLYFPGLTLNLQPATQNTVMVIVTAQETQPAPTLILTLNTIVSSNRTGWRYSQHIHAAHLEPSCSDRCSGADTRGRSSRRRGTVPLCVWLLGRVPAML